MTLKTVIVDSQKRTAKLFIEENRKYLVANLIVQSTFHMIVGIKLHAITTLNFIFTRQCEPINIDG